MNTNTQKKCAQLLNCTIQNIRSVHGGDINDAYRIDTSRGRFFVKVNSASKFPQMFEREAEGLGLLREAKVCLVPQVVEIGQEGDDAFLILEWMDSGNGSPSFWTDFGRALARLHKVSSDAFGLPSRAQNYIGSLPQYNQTHNDWATFYIEQRLRPQLRMDLARQLLSQQTLDDFEQLFQLLPNQLPQEPPSLIHGDLWSGNFMTSASGQAVLIDPATCFASREMDLAMTKLFGGFSPAFYQAYKAEYPIPDGFAWRIDLYQLYYLLVHVNLFGGHYAHSVARLVKRLCNS